jgi:hypothetical protein
MMQGVTTAPKVNWCQMVPTIESTILRFGTREARVASFPTLGVAFMRRSRVSPIPKARHEAALCHTRPVKRLFRAITSKTNGSNRAR